MRSWRKVTSGYEDGTFVQIVAVEDGSGEAVITLHSPELLDFCLHALNQAERIEDALKRVNRIDRDFAEMAKEVGAEGHPSAPLTPEAIHRLLPAIGQNVKDHASDLAIEDRIRGLA